MIHAARVAETSGSACDLPHHVKQLICVDDALGRIAQHVMPVPGTETLATPDARGRILAQALRSRAMVPPFDTAAMDGYALDTNSLSGAGPWVLPVVMRVPAGQVAARALSAGSAAQIFTGAPVPNGVDAVVMQEQVHREGDRIHLSHAPVPGANIRRAGNDMDRGDVVLDGGHLLTARGIGAAAAAGASQLVLRRRVRVGLLVTGDELRGPCDLRHAQDAQISDINTPMLRAVLDRPGLDLVAVLHGTDTRAGLRRQLADLASRTDLVVTTGGLSVGAEDHVKPALADLGAELLFSSVAIKPGKPVSLGRLGAATWIGLPGNPLAAFVTWQVFGPAVLRRLTGQSGSGPRTRPVVLAHPIRRRAGRSEFRLASLSGRDAHGRDIVSFEAATFSGRVGGLPHCDGMIHLPADMSALPQGTLVAFHGFEEC